VRPALPIVIHTAKNTLAVRALVDSGADYSVLPTSYARYLGVDLSACDEIASRTAGGRSVVRVHQAPLSAEVQAMGVRFKMKSAFADHANTILLGREDFFREFRVTIDEPAQAFTLEKL
jgi:predicted aspartyl protease